MLGRLWMATTVLCQYLHCMEVRRLKDVWQILLEFVQYVGCVPKTNQKPHLTLQWTLREFYNNHRHSYLNIKDRRGKIHLQVTLGHDVVVFRRSWLTVLARQQNILIHIFHFYRYRLFQNSTFNSSKIFAFYILIYSPFIIILVKY